MQDPVKTRVRKQMEKEAEEAAARGPRQCADCLVYIDEMPPKAKLCQMCDYKKSLHPRYRIPTPELKELMAAARTQHPKGGMQTASSCACGASSGGPAASLACRALLHLLERSEQLRRVDPDAY